MNITGSFNASSTGNGLIGIINDASGAFRYEKGRSYFTFSQGPNANSIQYYFDASKSWTGENFNKNIK